MNIWFRAAVAAALVALLCSNGANAANNSVTSFTVEAAFDDVLFDLTEALTNKGLVVDHKARVADMLNRTAKDVGASITVYKHGEVIEFCSARLSRAAMEADPLNMAFCPYSMFVYETVKNPGKVTVGFKILSGASSAASKKALDTVNKLMLDMVKEAAGVK